MNQRISSTAGTQPVAFGSRRPACALLLAAGCMLVGCASPGPPRAPSLQLPEPVHDLAVTREGNTVTVDFTLPQRTTDNLPIREGAVKGTLCFGLEGSPCEPDAARQDVMLKLVPGTAAAERSVTWTESLPPTDRSGDAKLLIIRVRLANLEGRSAGWSEPAYTAAGATPEPLEGFRAEETRNGILLAWQPGGAGEVLVRREALAPSGGRKSPGAPVWLTTHANTTGPLANKSLDDSATEDMPYRYTALRQSVVQLGQQKVEMRSASTEPVQITWRNLFPPASPEGLSAAPFSENGGFAVDLVWEPVEETGLKGYLVIRQEIDRSGSAIGAARVLTSSPLSLPAFHDVTAQPKVRYQYSVEALSHKDVKSAPATVIVEPATP